MKVPLIIALVLITTASLVGCAPSATTPAPAPVEVTRIIVVTATPEEATDTPVPTTVPEATPVPPTPTGPTFTSTSIPPLNCRSDPWVSYPWWEYRNAVSFLNLGQTVPIIGRNPPGYALWWYVTVNGINCWVSQGYGTTTGDVSHVPFGPVTFYPTQHGWFGYNNRPWNGYDNRSEKVKFKNATGDSICEVDLYIRGMLVGSPSWDKKEFKDGTSQIVWIPRGIDHARAFNCKPSPKPISSIWIDENDDSFTFDP